MKRGGRKIREARERDRQDRLMSVVPPALQPKGYDGANNSSYRRGYVFWPTLDTRRELRPYERLQLLRKARHFYANVGFARRVVNGLANLIGYLTPQAATNDRKWNAAAEAAFDNYAGEEFVFDRSGKYNFYTWQIENTRLRMKDGDCLTLLTETKTGVASTIIYEAHQIDNGNNKTIPDNLFDGVFCDRFGKHTRYRIVDPADKESITALDANDCIFYADFERPGQVRGVSALAHAVNRLQDIQEITGDWMHAIKIAAQIGYQLVRPGAGQGARGISSAVTAVTDSNTGTTTNVENLYGSGIIPQFGDGEKVELLQDERPHPNSVDLLYWITREIAWGVGVSPEVLWDITKQTGPSTRYLMAETQRWVQHEQGKLERICRRFWVYFIAKEIKAGRLPMPADEAWWKVNWVPQADQTIDRGRENQADLDNLHAGISSRTELCAKRGTDWERTFRKACEERAQMAEIAAEYGLEVDDVIPDLTHGTKAEPQPAADPHSDPSSDPNSPAE